MATSSICSISIKSTGNPILIKASIVESACKLINSEKSRLFKISKFSKFSKEIFNAIWEKSEGNPFYIEQIIYYLKENKFLIKKDGKYFLKSEKLDILDTITTSNIRARYNDCK